MMIPRLPFFTPVIFRVISSMLLLLVPASSWAHTHKEVAVLTMGSWRPDDIVQMNSLLDRFHALHPHIRILYDPTPAPEYDKVLLAQLQGDTAPDLFYLRSFSTSRKLYEAGYLAPLDGLSELSANFAPEHLHPWQSADALRAGLAQWFAPARRCVK